MQRRLEAYADTARAWERALYAFLAEKERRSGKGGKRTKRELPRPALEAIEAGLEAWGKRLEAMAPEESLWPTQDAGRTAQGLGVTSGTFYANLRGYLRAAGLPGPGCTCCAGRG